MEKLISAYLREKRFLTNASPRTIKYLQGTLNIWQKRIGALPDKHNIKEFVIGLQESRLSPYTINSYCRGINSFLTWLFENEHTSEQLRIKLIKEPQKTLRLFDDKQLKALLSYRGKTFADKRLYAMVVLAIDTGARIDEMLSLEREAVDFDNLLVRLHGKGDKERIVPISPECRKVIFKFLSSHESLLAFPSRDDAKLSYRVSLDQFKALCAQLGITGVRTSWHTLRHTFASAYVRDGGNVIYLQRLLGHCDLSVTKIYVRAQSEDLSLMHKRTSLLKRLS